MTAALRQAWVQLQGASLPYAAAALIFYAVSVVLMGQRWRLILRGMGQRVRLRDTTFTHLTSVFVNNVTPGRVGGEVFRVAPVIYLDGSRPYDERAISAVWDNWTNLPTATVRLEGPVTHQERALYVDLRGVGATPLQLCLFAGIFTTAGVASFVGYQLRQLMKETDTRNVALEQVRVEEVKMDALVDQLRQFGRTYPDYVPILNRVGLQAATSSSPAAASACPCRADPMGTADTASASAPVFNTKTTDTAGLNTWPTMRV